MSFIDPYRAVFHLLEASSQQTDAACEDLFMCLVGLLLGKIVSEHISLQNPGKGKMVVVDGFVGQHPNLFLLVMVS